MFPFFCCCCFPTPCSLHLKSLLIWLNPNWLKMQLMNKTQEPVSSARSLSAKLLQSSLWVPACPHALLATHRLDCYSSKKAVPTAGSRLNASFLPSVTPGRIDNPLQLYSHMQRAGDAGAGHGSRRGLAHVKCVCPTGSLSFPGFPGAKKKGAERRYTPNPSEWHITPKQKMRISRLYILYTGLLYRILNVLGSS